MGTGDDQSERAGGRTESTLGTATDFVLLRVDRRVLTLAILALVFASLATLALFAPVSVPSTMSDSYPIETLFQALVGAIITGVTLVVTITQLIVSQELGPAGDQRERMEGTMAFRDRIEDVIGPSPSPAKPAAFLRSLVEAAVADAEQLGRTGESLGDPVGTELADYAESITSAGRNVSRQLESAEFGTYAVIAAALRFDYSGNLYRGRHVRAQYGADLPDEVSDQLTNLVDTLALFGPAREHVKTLYFQWDLANLSRDILVLSVPALVVAAGSILFLNDPASVRGSTAGLPNLTWVVIVNATIAVAPFALLLSHILRIATIAKRTLAIGPFVLLGRSPVEPMEESP